MDPPSSDVPKLPDMVMCGDHPSFTKTELNAKEPKPEGRDKPKEKPPVPYARLTPTPSRTAGLERVERSERTASEHGLAGLRARRRVRSLEAVPRDLPAAPANRALVQAALGSFRWPPYLLCVWVLVLLLTHALHCLVGLLDKTLPNFKKLCQYFRARTEAWWKAEAEVGQRVWPLALALLTGGLYALYAALVALHAVAVWAVEPLCPDDEPPEQGLRVTTYLDEVASKTNSTIKP